MRKYHTLLVLAALGAMILFTGCTASGPGYAGVKQSGAITPRAGKGMVLFYRSSGFVSAAYKPYLYVNDVIQPSRLARGGFYSYEAGPGPLTLAYSKAPGESTGKTKTNAVIGGILTAGVLGGALAVSGDIEAHRRVGLNINVVPGQTNYIVMGGAGGDLREAPKEEGEEDIQDCHWLNPSHQ